jgi:hypothetical protein
MIIESLLGGAAILISVPLWSISSAPPTGLVQIISRYVALFGYLLLPATLLTGFVLIGSIWTLIVHPTKAAPRRREYGFAILISLIFGAMFLMALYLSGPSSEVIMSETLKNPVR